MIELIKLNFKELEDNLYINVCERQLETKSYKETKEKESKIVEEYESKLTDEQLKTFNKFLDDFTFSEYETNKFFYFQGMLDTIDLLKKLMLR